MGIWTSARGANVVVETAALEVDTRECGRTLGVKAAAGERVTARAERRASG